MTTDDAMGDPSAFVAGMAETRTATVTHPGDGSLIEYRRGDCSACLSLESRVLRPDGTPHDDRWHPVSDRGWVWLRHVSPAVVRFLLPELEHSGTLTPRG